MHTVFIVDDEPWVAYGIKALVDWESLGYTVIGEAYNGLSALETIKEKKPEVVISDIRMPGLDGIELLEHIHQQELGARVILISGYSEFEYAQKALRLGAFDYLLKQVDKDKLTNTLVRLKKALEEKQEAQKVVDLFLDDLFDIFEPDHKMKVHNFLASRGMGFEHPHYRFVSCLYEGTPFFDPDERAVEVAGICYLRFRTGQQKVSYLINYDELNFPVGLLNFISDHLSDAQRIGISGIGVYSSSVAKLYQESDVALFSSITRPDERMIEYKAVDHAPELMKTVLQIELVVKEQNPELLNRWLDELCEECRARHMQINQISSFYNQIVSLFYKYYGINEAVYEIEYLNYYQIFRQFNSIEQLFDSLKEMFRKQSEEELYISNDTVRKIIENIDSSYTEEIMLGDLSGKFNISLGYLSTLIKKETGRTYSEYVMSKRLNLAKQLLSDGSLSIQEIVGRVGYKDYFHFNKLFKKHYGITPSKYRKM